MNLTKISVAKNLFLFFFLFISYALFSQEFSQTKTLKLQQDEKGQPATLDQINWIVGDWVGPGLGGQCEESWRPASGGNMLGMFKYLRDGKANFYEIMTIIEKDSSPSHLVKHFSADFVAWEDKEEHTEFRLVKLEKNKAYFDGLTFHKLDNKHMNIYLRVKHDDQTIEHEINLTLSK